MQVHLANLFKFNTHEQKFSTNKRDRESLTSVSKHKQTLENGNIYSPSLAPSSLFNFEFQFNFVASVQTNSKQHVIFELTSSDTCEHMLIFIV
jgi:hypothetical protein